MKTTIKLPISKNDKVLVSEGDALTSQTPVLERNSNAVSKTLHVSSLLKVKEKLIHKFLKKNLGEAVSSGEIIVEKKGWWSTVSLKSPISGKMSEVDLKTGTITIIGLDFQDSEKLKIPIPGKVSNITSSGIEIDVSAALISGDKGEGPDVSGKLVYFPGERINIFDFGSDVENEIVLIKKMADEIMVKLDVLGAKGVLTIKPLAEMTLPFIRIDEDKFARLVHFKGNTVWMRPTDKQIFIVE